MTNPVGIVGSTPSNAPQAPAASSAAATQNNADFKALVSGGPSGPISPRIVVDPQAGVITEFLNQTGIVQSQIPSAAVVAYLRAGLTSDGLAKPSATPAPSTDSSGGSSSPDTGGSVIA